MPDVTAEQLAEWKALADAATEGPWSTGRPGKDALTAFTRGVIVAAVARGQGIYADPRGGSYPENDRCFIAAARTAVPALVAEIERLWEGLECAHAYRLVGGAMTRVAVEPGSIPDGIECRDETIRQQDRRIVEQRAEIERLCEARDARQKVVADWCAASFGAGAASSLPQRSVRLLEEVIEAYQAAGGDPAMAHKLVDFVFARPVGELSKEIGAVGLVLLSLANAAGVSADAEEAREVARVLAKPNSHWAARNANKNAAGFDTSRAALPEEPADG